MEFLQTINQHCSYQMLWSLSWQVSILVVIIWFLSFLTRKSSPTFCYWLWCIILVRLCIPVNISNPFGLTYHIRIKVEENIQSFIKTLPTVEQTENTSPLINLSPSNKEQPVEASISSLKISDLIIIFWITIVTIMSAIVLFRVLHFKHHLKKCSRVERSDIKAVLEDISKKLEINRTINVYYMNKDIMDSPMVTGVFRPKIFLTATITDNWNIDELKPILTHELVHIKRYDPLVNIIQIITQTIFFFHPLVWYANWKIRALREEVCDDIAINAIDKKRKHYAQCIINVLESITHEPSFVLADLNFSERKSSLAKRIIRLVNKKYKFYQPLNIPSIISLVIISIFSIAIACDTPVGNITGETFVTGNLTPDKETAPVLIPYTEETLNLVVKIIKSGEYEVEGVLANYSNLESVLSKEMEKNNTKAIDLQTGTEFSLEDVNYIVNTAHELGIKYVGLKKSGK